ncbi:MAG TPA: redoxin domain-containing protein, partial [Bryobacteraceae bacterium]|nr:redoxin domain-containing protein [Bryobacteraceae bacterium]
LVNFWTYSCIYSLRELPYMKAWAAKYKAAGLVVIGVHTPEFSFEKDEANVSQAIRDYAVTYPVAINSNYSIWRGFHNRYWPANYIIDASGRIRHSYFGEGAYEQLEQIIRDLLRERGATSLDDSAVAVPTSEVEAPPSKEVHSPETYVGYGRGDRFVSSSQVAQDRPRLYSLPNSPSLNEWGLEGLWNIGADRAVLQKESGQIVFRFRSRDLHMVLAPSPDGNPVRFRVTLDGREPSADRGSDVTPEGAGVVQAPRLYQLIRQKGLVTDRTFRIEFLDRGVQAFTFTFG